jgi:hypothetical protein
METYSFYREKDQCHDKFHWYIDLPEFPGMKAELEMVEGADTMLDLFLQMYGAEGSDKISLQISLEPVDGFGVLEKIISTEKDETVLVVGGGYYILKSYEGFEYNIEMWLCEVTRYVFGGMPEKIYFKIVK